MTEAILTCPKCGGTMRRFERSGITVDQCSECRGVFLDRGELERLIDAEGGYYAKRGAQSGQEERSHEGAGPKRKRRGGFLGDLFELGE